MNSARLVNTIVVLAISLAFFVCLFNPVFADTGINQAQTGLNQAAHQGYLGNSGNTIENTGIITSIPGAVGKIIGAVLSFIGVLFFLLLIYGGFMWMTARGNDEQVKKAIELITAACIGLAIIAAAYLVTRFIGETLLNP